MGALHAVDGTPPRVDLSPSSPASRKVKNQVRRWCSAMLKCVCIDVDLLKYCWCYFSVSITTWSVSHVHFVTCMFMHVDIDCCISLLLYCVLLFLRWSQQYFKDGRVITNRCRFCGQNVIIDVILNLSTFLSIVG